MHIYLFASVSLLPKKKKWLLVDKWLAIRVRELGNEPKWRTLTGFWHVYRVWISLFWKEHGISIEREYRRHHECFYCYHNAMCILSLKIRRMRLSITINWFQRNKKTNKIETAAHAKKKEKITEICQCRTKFNEPCFDFDPCKSISNNNNNSNDNIIILMNLFMAKTSKMIAGRSVLY